MSQNGSRNGKAREDLLRRSHDMRAKLVRSVERLDERRHDAFDVRKQIQRHLRAAAIAGGLVIVGTAGTAAFVMYRIMTSHQRRRGARWRLAKGMWQNPERELRAQRGPFAGEVLRSLAFSVVTAVLSSRLRRAVGVRR
jgi:hypothetical protein